MRLWLQITNRDIFFAGGLSTLPPNYSVMKRTLYVLSVLATLLFAGAASAGCVINLDDVQLLPGASADIPLMIYEGVDVAAGQADISYDPNVIEITNILDGDLDWTMSNLAVDGDTVRVVILSLGGGVDGDITMATLQVTAIGDIGDVSPLTMTDTTIGDSDANDIPATISDGSVTIVSDNTPPVIDEMYTMEFTPGGYGTIGVRAHDPDGSIASVKFDLTVFGLGIVEANQINGDDYMLEFQMPAGMLPGAYNVGVEVTDDDDAVTTDTFLVSVVIMGDVNSDGEVTSADALLVCQYITTPEAVSINLDVADVVADGQINVLDAIRILNIAAGNTYE